MIVDHFKSGKSVGFNGVDLMDADISRIHQNTYLNLFMHAYSCLYTIKNNLSMINIDA